MRAVRYVEAGVVTPLARDFTVFAFHCSVTLGRVEVMVVLLGFGFWVDA